MGGSALPPKTVLHPIPAPPARDTPHLPDRQQLSPITPAGLLTTAIPGPHSPALQPCPFALESLPLEEQHPRSRPPQAGMGSQPGSLLELLVCGPWASPSPTSTLDPAQVCPTAG